MKLKIISSEIASPAARKARQREVERKLSKTLHKRIRKRLADHLEACAKTAWSMHDGARLYDGMAAELMQWPAACTGRTST